MKKFILASLIVIPMAGNMSFADAPKADGKKVAGKVKKEKKVKGSGRGTASAAKADAKAADKK